MRSGRVLPVVAVALLWAAGAPAQTTLTVGSGGGHDYETIQAAIDAATTGDTILVTPGVYPENIHLHGIDITLRSMAPAHRPTVAATVIDGRSSGPVVTFSGTETSSCVLSGFTIRNGRAMVSPLHLGGGIHGGSGRGYTAARIEYNIVTGNDAEYGGGISGCNGVIRYNTIADNSAVESGGGGGLASCNAAIRNNIIAGNSAREGGGLRSCDGAIENNAIVGNRAERGPGLSRCRGTITNAIVWANRPGNGPIPGGVRLLEPAAVSQLYDCTTPPYSCVEDWTGGGSGNLSSDPLFVDSDGPDDDPETFEDNDYRLAFGSPCIDAGDPNTSFNDANRPPGLRTVRNDLGAYGGPHSGDWPVQPATDLAGSLAGLMPPEIIAGGQIALQGRVVNQGDAPALSPAWVEFIAIQRETGWTGYVCDSLRVEPMEVGASLNLGGLGLRRVYDIPVGDYAVMMQIDGLDEVPEWDETNNAPVWYELTILPDQPNLAVQQFDFQPQEANPGGRTTIRFQGRVVNTGSQPTTGAFWIEYLVRPAGQPSAPPIYLCDSSFVSDPLEVGGAIDLADSPRTTYALATGVYTVGLRLDPIDDVAEQREDDNLVWIRHRALYVGVAPTRARRWSGYR